MGMHEGGITAGAFQLLRSLRVRHLHNLNQRDPVFSWQGVHRLGKRNTLLLVAVILHQVGADQPVVGRTAVTFVVTAIRLFEERGNNAASRGSGWQGAGVGRDPLAPLDVVAESAHQCFHRYELPNGLHDFRHVRVIGSEPRADR